jgi:hypothetical protein
MDITLNGRTFGCDEHVGWTDAQITLSFGNENGQKSIILRAIVDENLYILHIFFVQIIIRIFWIAHPLFMTCSLVPHAS